MVQARGGEHEWLLRGASGDEHGLRARHVHAQHLRMGCVDGFSPLVERALAPGPNVFEGLQIVQLDGQPNVMKAEMIGAMLSLMSVGDARAPKNLTLVRKIKEREAAAPNEPLAARIPKQAIQQTTTGRLISNVLRKKDTGGPGIPTCPVKHATL